MPYVDHPLPADLELPAINPKPKSLPPRKKKGAIAKISRDVKAGILNGAIACGYDGAGEGGLDGFFLMCAQRHPKAYLALLGKFVPLQVSADVPGQTIGSINIVSVPRNHFLSGEMIEKWRRNLRCSLSMHWSRSRARWSV
jgi:hypothetical protein